MEEQQHKEDATKNFTEKGKKMAANLAEVILMRHFFANKGEKAEPKDRKKWANHRQQFMLDMQFNLGTGKVIPGNARLKDNAYNVRNKHF